MAPALGLYLGELFFDGYNKKQRQQMENDLRLAKKRAEAKGKVWPPPAAAAPAAVTAPPAVADADAGEESAENPAKRAKLNPTAEGEVAAEGGSGSSSSAMTKPAAAEKDDEGQVNIYVPMIQFLLLWI